VVEHDLAKVGVEGSNPFARSRIFKMAKFDEGPLTSGLFVFWNPRVRRNHSRDQDFAMLDTTLDCAEIKSATYFLARRNFFSICFDLTGPRSARFSRRPGVIAFLWSGLPYA
jgi:hypothetical protein